MSQNFVLHLLLMNINQPLQQPLVNLNLNQTQSESIRNLVQQKNSSVRLMLIQSRLL